MNIPILSILIFLPLTGAILFIFIPREKINLLKYLAVAITVLTFLVALPLYFNFDGSTADAQFVETAEWIGYGINYHVGIDGISLSL